MTKPDITEAERRLYAIRMFIHPRARNKTDCDAYRYIPSRELLHMKDAALEGIFDLTDEGKEVYLEKARYLELLKKVDEYD